MRVCVLTDEEPEDFDPGPFLGDYPWELVTMRAPVFQNLGAAAGDREFEG